MGASAAITLAASVPVNGGTTQYTYDVAVKNTGTTPVGTFWFAWLPDEDFLRTPPTNVGSPDGWTSTLVGTNDSADGTSILWKAGTGAGTFSPHATLAGFSFTTTDSPAVLAGKAATFPDTDVLTSVVYSGHPFSDAGFTFNATLPSTGPTTPAATTLAAPKTAKSYNFDRAVKLTALLKSAGPKKGTFSGAATIVEGDEPIGTATISKTGAITFSSKAVAPLAAGDHTLNILYSGDAAHATVTSDAFTLHVLPAKTTTKLATSPTKPTVGALLTLSVQVAAKGISDAKPTGTVTFKDGDAVLGTADLDANGLASFVVTSPVAGAHAYAAVYAGDTNFAAATSAPKKLNLKA